MPCALSTSSQRVAIPSIMSLMLPHIPERIASTYAVDSRASYSNYSSGLGKYPPPCRYT